MLLEVSGNIVLCFPHPQPNPSCTLPITLTLSQNNAIPHQAPSTYPESSIQAYPTTHPQANLDPSFPASQTDARRYFKQSEIILFRQKPEDVAAAQIQAQSQPPQITGAAG